MSDANFTKEQRETLDDIVKHAQLEMSDEKRRYIDISRIPLICFSIVQIGKDISSIRETITANDKDKEMRIRGLENASWKLMGMGILITPVLATIVTIFITKTIN